MKSRGLDSNIANQESHSLRDTRTSGDVRNVTEEHQEMEEAPTAKKMQTVEHMVCYPQLIKPK